MICVPGTGWAQQTSVRLEAATLRVTVDEELQVRLRASGTYDEVDEVASEGFEFRQGGHQTQVNIIGAQMARTEAWTFVGTPRRPGKFTIGPVELKSDGQVVATSNTLQIEVVGNDTSSLPAVSPQVAADLRQFAGQPFFVRSQLSIQSPYVGQPLVLTYELYWTRTMRVHGIREVSAPRWGNADVEDVLAKNRPESEEVMVEGRPYLRQLTHRVVLTPPVPGKLRLDGPAYRIEAGDAFETRAKRVTTQPLEIEVRPVPSEARPETFVEGNVGRLTVAGALTRPGGSPVTSDTPVNTDERLLLEYNVRGEGNLLGLRAVRVPTVAGMTVEDLPGRSDAGVQRTRTGTVGQRTWQSVVSFSRPGTFTVPLVEWTAFDPDTEKFATSQAGPFTVVVAGVAGAPEAAPGTATGTAAEDSATNGPVQPASAHLQPIAVDAGLASSGNDAWVRQPWFRWLAAAPWLGALAVLAHLLLQQRRRRAAPKRQRAQALQEACAQLRQAQNETPDRGYAALRESVAAYLQRAAGVQPGGLTQTALAAQLHAAGVAADAVGQLLVELEHCDFARFAPGGDRAIDLEQTAARLTDVLERIDAQLLAHGSRLATAGQGAAAPALLLLILAASLGLASGAHAATLDDTFTKANKAFVAGDYAAARAGYEALLDHDVQSAAVHYNLANTLVHQRQSGRAIGQYEEALRLAPNDVLRADIQRNLMLVRRELGDRARRQHATLHVFDEAPEVGVALAQAAPESLLGILALIGGFGALALIVLRVWRRRQAGEGVALWTGVAVCLVLHGTSLAWLWQASHVRNAFVQAVVVEEDASLTACVGAGEQIGLPEGLLLRRVSELPDGRIEVRLPNGREGCLAPTAIATIR